MTKPRITPHGASKGDFIAGKGRNLVSKIHRKTKSDETPVYRKFSGQIFRLHSFRPSIREANWEMGEYKENFFIRKVRLPGNKGYVIYVRDKRARRGQ